jgi:hypothetical protein
MADDQNFLKLKKDIDRLEQTKDYISWIQEFSKKVVAITFLLYLIANFFIMFIIYKEVDLGAPEISQLCTEINETFRIVIGGYLIKAGVENTFKIGGSYLLGVSNVKLKVLKNKLNVDDSEEEESEEYDSDISIEDEN